MPVITDIQVQRKNQERVSIFLDGEFAFGLAMITALRLRRGQTLSAEEIEALQAEDAYERGKEAAMRLISQRPRSIREVAQRMRKKEFDAETIDRVTARFVELDLLDDRAFARYWLDQRDRFKPRGAMALRQELAQKGVSRDIIDEVLADLDADSAALRAGQTRVSRWQNLPEEEFRKKMHGYLQRRGFDYETTRRTINQLWATVQTEE